MEERSRLDEFKEQVQQQDMEDALNWEDEIRILEGRTKEWTEITLDKKGKQKIKVIKRLPADIAEDFEKFRERWTDAGIRKNHLDLEKKKGNLTDKQYKKELENLKVLQDELEKELCKWLSVICVNPLLTQKFFMERKDQYSAEDILLIIFGWYEGIAERVNEKVQEVEKRAKMKKFLVEPTR